MDDSSVPTGSLIDPADGAPVADQEVGASVPPQSVLASWDLAYSTEGPPIAVRVGPLGGSGHSWGVHEIVLVGAQGEYVVDLRLPATELEVDGAVLTAVDGGAETWARLGFDDEVSLRVSLPEELPAGEHLFFLNLPVWVNRVEPDPDRPDDHVVVTLSYTVQSVVDRDAVETFCAEAVPIANGSIPTMTEIDQLRTLAIAELDPDAGQELVDALDQLDADGVAFLEGTRSHSTNVDVNQVIGRLCNVEMESESISNN